jgi:hypothetical protein
MRDRAFVAAPTEGDWFAVPLKGGGYALGVLARVGRRSGIAFGYFFGPKRAEPPAEGDLAELTVEDAVFACRFGDDAIEGGKWPMVGRREWSREEWPMPAFCTASEVAGPTYRVDYDEDDPNKVAATTPISREECERLPDDELWGSGALASRLTRLLDAAALNEDAPEPAGRHEWLELRAYLYFASKEAADKAAAELRARSFEVGIHMTADRGEYLLLATRSTLPDRIDDEIDALEPLFEEIAGRFGGEYDGFEREVGGRGHARRSRRSHP